MTRGHITVNHGVMKNDLGTRFENHIRKASFKKGHYNVQLNGG